MPLPHALSKRVPRYINFGAMHYANSAGSGYSLYRNRRQYRAEILGELICTGVRLAQAHRHGHRVRVQPALPITVTEDIGDSHVDLQDARHNPGGGPAVKNLARQSRRTHP